MKEKKTYAELMKSRNTQKTEENGVTILDIYIQMVLDEALYKQRLTFLREEIDKALDQRDEKRFNGLSAQYAEHCLHQS
ncbi:IDEAL domain-containing protein [Bacillus altitudinis]|uniref:IDEAL domain-containing protein n=1 Tax=Bacillus altitudinis TaxID=293387 RepID=UPI000963E742|nr:IDEAL domain-containing protein [Bacillus altitudinis]SIT86388.1 IDEAL domain-containing protein [Bacillus altitudinis]